MCEEPARTNAVFRTKAAASGVKRTFGNLVLQVRGEKKTTLGEKSKALNKFNILVYIFSF